MAWHKYCFLATGTSPIITVVTPLWFHTWTTVFTCWDIWWLYKNALPTYNEDSSPKTYTQIELILLSHRLHCMRHAISVPEIMCVDSWNKTFVRQWLPCSAVTSILIFVAYCHMSLPWSKCLTLVWNTTCNKTSTAGGLPSCRLMPRPYTQLHKHKA